MPSDLPPAEPVDLNDQWSIEDALRFELDEAGLPRAVISPAGGDAQVYLHGGHVTQYQPKGAEPVLWMSRLAAFAEGTAIRGGVPICFPWFGPKTDDPDAPAHGPARLSSWEVLEVFYEEDGLDLELGLTIDPFRLVYRIAVGPELSLTLTATNVSAEPAQFEAALHTYLSVSDVQRVNVAGLEGVSYYDKTDGGALKTQGSDPIAFTGETDRLYINTQAPCIMEDPGLQRRIIVDKSGSESTVIWNPWTDKASRLADFGDDQWTQMLCVETANAADNAVSLAPGAEHSMTQTLRVAST